MNKKKIYFIVFASLFSCQIFGAQALLQPLNLDFINRLQEQLRQYYENDDHLKNLHDVLSTQKEQLIEYNTLVNNISSNTVILTQEQLAIINRLSFQNLIQVSNTEVEQLFQLSNVIIQSKNIDPSWQIKKYGTIFGSLFFMKNLLMPRNTQAYICAGIGALTSFVFFKNQLKASPTIQINVPQGATNITINDDTQKKLATTVAVCAFSAGGVVAGAQIYNSWMYEKNSRDTLTDKIKAIKSSNAQIGFAFNTMGIHTVLARQEQAVGALGNQVAQVQQSIATTNNGIMQLQQNVIEDRNIATYRYDEMSNRFNNVDNKISQISDKVTNFDVKVDQILLDQNEFQQFVTNLVTDSNEKLEQCHEKITQVFKDINKNAAEFRNETAAAYNHLDTKLDNIQLGMAQGQSRLESLLLQNRLQDSSVQKLLTDDDQGSSFECVE